MTRKLNEELEDAGSGTKRRVTFVAPTSPGLHEPRDASTKPLPAKRKVHTTNCQVLRTYGTNTSLQCCASSSDVPLPAIRLEHAIGIRRCLVSRCDPDSALQALILHFESVTAPKVQHSYGRQLTFWKPATSP